MSKTELSAPQTGLALPGGGFLPTAELATLDVDKMERILALAGERSLQSALARFQGDAPAVEKTKRGGQGNYAPFDAIMAAIRPHLASNGLSVSFDTETGSGSVTATCYVMHADGGRISRKATVPVDARMSANDSQKMGSAISYAKRYALTAALNLVTADEIDDDGAKAGTETVTDLQADQLREVLDEVDEATRTRFWGWVRESHPDVSTADDLPASLFAKSMRSLRAKVKGGAA